MSMGKNRFQPFLNLNTDEINVNTDQQAMLTYRCAVRLLIVLVAVACQPIVHARPTVSFFEAGGADTTELFSKKRHQGIGYSINERHAM